MSKPNDPAKALNAVLKALEPLNQADRLWVLQSASSRWTLAFPPAAVSAAPALTGQAAKAGALDVQAAIAAKDARAFIRLKRPSSDVERVACLGYYFVKTTGKPGFTGKDVAATNTDAGGTKINLHRALDNATRRSRYLSSRGGHEKQLTTLGEDVVEALPDREAVTRAEAEGTVRPGSKRKKPKKTR